MLAKKKFWFFIFFSQYVQKIYKNLQKFVRLQKKNEFFDFRLVIYAIYICIIHTQLYNICGCVCVCFVYVCLLRDMREAAKERERKRRQEVLLQLLPPSSLLPLSTCHALLRSSSCSAPVHLHLLLLLTPPVPAPHPPHRPRRVQSPHHPPQLLPAPPALQHALSTPPPLPPSPLCVVGDCLD